MEIVDLRIIYQKGAPIAYIRPLTIQERRWLWNHVKYPYSGSNAIVDAEQLLLLVQQMDADRVGDSLAVVIFRRSASHGIDPQQMLPGAIVQLIPS